METDTFEDCGVHLLPAEAERHAFKYLGHHAYLFDASTMLRLPEQCYLLPDNTLRSKITGRLLCGFGLDKNRLISMLTTPRGLVQDGGTGKVVYGVKMMSSYEKQLRILTVLLLSGIFHREVHLMAIRLYRIAVIPDSTIQEVTLDDLMFSKKGFQHCSTRKFPPLHVMHLRTFSR